MKKTKTALIVILVIVLAMLAALTSYFAAFEITLSSSSGEEAAAADWQLILVNNDYHLPKGYTFEKLRLSNGEYVDKRIYPDLQKMFDDMRAAGVYPFVREGYRTAAEQKDILLEKVKENIDHGHSPFKAYELARTSAAAVGNSEHQLGLAVDINADLDKSDPWDVYTWLNDNAYKYGFILRYPEGKTDITGIVYEPWHYRYVGKEAAEEMHESGQCLEEYLADRD